MTHQNLMDLKSQLESYRDGLVEEVSDANQCIKMHIDGHFKIRRMTIHPELESSEIEQLLPILFSKAIDLIAEKIRLKLEELQAAQN